MSVDHSSTGSWSIFPGQPRVFAASISRRPATPQEAEAAPGRPAASLAARSPLAGSSTTATDPAEAVPGRQGDARYGTAATDPADTPRRPSPARRTPRSTDAPPAPYGPADSCPAPAAPSPDQVWPPDPAATRSTGSGTAHHRAAAASPLKPPYREGRQPVGPGVEHEPDGTTGTTVRQRDETRRGRCNQHPTADGTRPRYGEALRPMTYRHLLCSENTIHNSGMDMAKPTPWPSGSAEGCQR